MGNGSSIYLVLLGAKNTSFVGGFLPRTAQESSMANIYGRGSVYFMRTYDTPILVVKTNQSRITPQFKEKFSEALGLHKANFKWFYKVLSYGQSAQVGANKDCYTFTYRDAKSKTSFMNIPQKHFKVVAFDVNTGEFDIQPKLQNVVTIPSPFGHVNYSVDDNGVLFIYLGHIQIATVEDCGRMKESELVDLVEDVLSESGYVWATDGSVGRGKTS